jgi:NAD(P)H dehydrogenase (quinone)
MKNPTPRIQMLDGFNEGWIMFEGDPGRSLKGTIELDTVIRRLMADFQSAGKG